jgi:hypothetical protein
VSLHGPSAAHVPATLPRVSEGEPSKPSLRRVAKGDHWLSGPAILYLDDIEKIYGLFRQVSSDVRLRLDGYELQSPADAAQLTSTTTADLEIHSNAPYATFEAYVNDFRFYVSDRDDVVLIGLRDATKEIVQKRRLWAPRSILPFWLFLVPSWLLWVVPKGPYSPLAVSVAIAGIALFWAAFVITTRNRYQRSGKVILRDSRTWPSFKKRNRDLLLVLLGIVGELVVIVVGGIVLYALGFIAKP